MAFLAPAGEKKPLVIKIEEKEGTCNVVKDTAQDAMTGFESSGRIREFKFCEDTNYT